MTDQRTIKPNEDAVCGMTVNVDEVRNKGLTLQHGGREFAFCGKGCMLDFRDEPKRYLSTDYQPSM